MLLDDNLIINKLKMIKSSEEAGDIGIELGVKLVRIGMPVSLPSAAKIAVPKANHAKAEDNCLSKLAVFIALMG